MTREKKPQMPLGENALQAELDQLKKELQLSRNQYASILNASPDGIVITDLRGHILKASPSAMEMFGFENEKEIMGKPLTHFILSGERARVALHIARILQGQKLGLIEYAALRADGSTFDAEVNAEILRNTEGDPSQFVLIVRDIGERKRTGAELQESEAQTQALINAIPDLIFTNHRNGEYLTVHAADPSLLAAPPEAVLHRKINEVLPQPLADQCLKAIEDALDSNAIQVLTYSITIDAQERHFEARVSPCTNDTAITIVRDITARKRVEKALRDSETRYRTLFEVHADGILIADVDTKELLYTNPAIQQIFGYTKEELLSMTMKDLHPKAALPHVIAEFEAQARGEKNLAADLPCVRKDGSVFYADINTSSLLLQGRLCNVGFFRDITERKQAEAKLKERETSYFELFNTVKQAIYIQNPDGTFINVNQGALDMYGYKREDFIGKTPEFLSAPDKNDMREVIRLVDLAFQGHPQKFEFWGKRKNGAIFPKDVWIVKGRYFGKEVLITLADDITERKQAEEEKVKLEINLQQAHKMESIGRLAGGVAHDFNNMLAVILGRTEMAMEQVNPTLPLHEDLREIQKAGERSADLTRQLLAFARKQTVTPQILDLNETVENMLQMLRRLIGEEIDLQWHPAAECGPVRMDPSQIDQILANLCVNARDAIDGIGQITIETGIATLEASDCVKQADRQPGEYVLLSATDTGKGMDKETQKHIFEPFFTTKVIGKGTGLGLATVYGAVRQNKGFIDITSAPGKGSTFRIYLPRHTGKAPPVRIEKQEPATRQGEETILVVEDEPAILHLATKMLKRQGYNVLAADTPGKAIQMARENHGEIHLLITDIVMPEMNGRDLAKTLLSLYPQINRLFMSGYTADVIAHQGVLDEGVCFIQKPFTQKELTLQVRKALDRSG